MVSQLFSNYVLLHVIEHRTYVYTNATLTQSTQSPETGALLKLISKGSDFVKLK